MEDRNITKIDVEFYLLNREYNELTTEEHAIVKEYVESEQEFNEMKAVLMGAGDFFNEEKELEPNPAIKAALLKEFDKQQPAGAYWLNGIFVSLFPKEKKIYQKPGMQLIGLAASVLLVITIAFNGNNDLNNPTLAQNEEVKTEEETVKEVKELERKEVEAEKSFVEDAFEAPKDVLEKEVELDKLDEIESEEVTDDVATNASMTALFMYDAQPTENVASDLSVAAATDQELDNRRDMNNSNESEGYIKKESSKDKGVVTVSDDKLVISATTIATSEIAEEINDVDVADYFAEDETTITATGSVAPGMVGNSVDLPVASRTLAEDSDLIGILYTAM